MFPSLTKKLTCGLSILSPKKWKMNVFILFTLNHNLRTKKAQIPTLLLLLLLTCTVEHWCPLVDTNHNCIIALCVVGTKPTRNEKCQFSKDEFSPFFSFFFFGSFFFFSFYFFFSFKNLAYCITLLYSFLSKPILFKYIR